MRLKFIGFYSLVQEQYLQKTTSWHFLGLFNLSGLAGKQEFAIIESKLRKLWN